MISHDILNQLLLLEPTIIDAYKSCEVIIGQSTLSTGNGKVALIKNVRELSWMSHNVSFYSFL